MPSTKAGHQEFSAGSSRWPRRAYDTSSGGRHRHDAARSSINTLARNFACEPLPSATFACSIIPFLPSPRAFLGWTISAPYLFRPSNRFTGRPPLYQHHERHTSERERERQIVTLPLDVIA